MAELEPVYLLTGSDRPKIETAVGRLRARFASEATEIASAVETSGAEAAALCNAGSLFGNARLVLVEDVDGRPNAEGRLTNGWKAADVEAVAAYLKSPAPDAVLALVAHELRKEAPLAKLVAKHGSVLAYSVAKREITSWVRERFRAQGVAADHEACQALVHIVGEDLHALAQEVEKIAVWAQGEPVEERDVRRLAAPLAEPPIYAITDAWGRRDAGGALEACEELLERSGRPHASTVAILASALARQARVLRRAGRLDERGVRPRDAARELGVRHDFQAARAFESARNFTGSELDAAAVRVAALDHALKGGSRVHADLEVQRALVDLCRRPGPRGGG